MNRISDKLISAINYCAEEGLKVTLAHDGLHVRDIDAGASQDTAAAEGNPEEKRERTARRRRYTRRYQPSVNELKNTACNSGYYRDYHIVLNVIKVAMQHLLEKGLEIVARNDLASEVAQLMHWQPRTADNYMTRATKYEMLEIVGINSRRVSLYKVAIPTDKLKPSEQRSSTVINFDQQENNEDK